MEGEGAVKGGRAAARRVSGGGQRGAEQYGSGWWGETGREETEREETGGEAARRGESGKGGPAADEAGAATSMGGRNAAGWREGPGQRIPRAEDPPALPRHPILYDGVRGGLSLRAPARAQSAVSRRMPEASSDAPSVVAPREGPSLKIAIISIANMF